MVKTARLYDGSNASRRSITAPKIKEKVQKKNKVK